MYFGSRPVPVVAPRPPKRPLIGNAPPYCFAVSPVATTRDNLTRWQLVGLEFLYFDADGLPVEQPTEFDLMINMKTAKVLGLTIPQTMVLQ